MKGAFLMGNFISIFENIIGVMNDILWGDFLSGILIVAGHYISIWSRIVQHRYIKQMFIELKDEPENLPAGTRDISAFKAFTISAASRVGTGNVAGVATAIVLGGHGAVFWMWVIAFIGAGTAFFESTLGQLYKVRDKEGGYRGGPAYYMAEGLNQKWLA